MKGIKKYGSEGSISFFYKGMLCSTHPLTKNKTFDYYKNKAENKMLDAIKSDRYNLKQQIYVCKIFCDLFVDRRSNKSRMNTQDHLLLMTSIFVLLKTKQIENDNDFGYLIMPRRKKNSHLLRQLH